MTVDVLLGKSLRRTCKPRLDDQLVEIVEEDPVQAHEDRWIAVEMWRGEEDAWIISEERFLRAEVFYPRSEDRTGGHVVAKSSNVGGAKRALPDEPLVPYSPKRMVA